MSTLALEPSDGARRGGRSAALGRHLDLVVLALALPVFIVAGLPVAAYLAIGAAWLVQRGIQHWAAGRIARAGERVSALRLIAGSFITRLWVLTIAILAVGLAADDEAGLSAAVLAGVLVTAGFAGEALARSGAREDER